VSRRQVTSSSSTQDGVAVGYARALDDARGIERQRGPIRAEARRRGLSLAWSCDTSDRRETLDRSGIARSLRLLQSDRHPVLIVADLRCITRSLPVLSTFFRRSEEEEWEIISLGPVRIDTTRPEGKVLRSVLGLYDATALVDEDDSDTPQELHDRPMQPSLRQRIVWERIVGSSLGQIANGLNRDCIAAPGEVDGPWAPSTVWAELEAVRPPGGS
jgi:Resolvase, N terminal domain